MRTTLIGVSGTDPERPLSAIPSPLARAVAFVAILICALAGASIGYSMVDIQCSGACGTPLGIGIFVGAVIGAAGMSVVSVLVLRAIGEWREMNDRNARSQ